MLFCQKLCLGVVLPLCLLLSGCADNPGTWPQPKLISHVKDSLTKQGLEMSEVTLTPKDGGGYEGTGMVVGGETLKLIVTQDAAARRLTWDATGDRGSFHSGSYELK